MLALVAIICVYGILATLVSGIFSERLIPMGPPLLKVSRDETDFVLLLKVRFLNMPFPLCPVLGGKEAGNIARAAMSDSQLTTYQRSLEDRWNSGGRRSMRHSDRHRVRLSCILQKSSGH